MILNAFTLTYLLCSTACLATIAMASLTGVNAGWRWDRSKETEDRYRLEKRVYLVVTLLSVAFVGRIFMIPLWFFALHSLIPSIPGALCLVGVHQASFPAAGISSGMKLITPALYLYWLQLHGADRRIPTQPLMQPKLLFLAPLGLFALVEVCMDLRSLFSVPLRRVSCCASLIDAPTDVLATPAAVALPLWPWSFFLLSCLVLCLLYLQARATSRCRQPSWHFSLRAACLCTALTAATLVSYGMTLHTYAPELSGGVLSGPCLFCAVQESLLVALSLGCVLVAASWHLACSWAVCHSKFPVDHPGAMAAVKRSLLTCFTLCAVGTALLAIQLTR